MTNGTRRKKWQDIEQMGQRIREARERLGLTQEALAELIGRDQHTISHYETGSRALIVTELPALARALRVPISYFFGDYDPDGEVLDLASELKLMPPRQKKQVIARWRLELDWAKQHDPDPEEIAQER